MFDEVEKTKETDFFCLKDSNGLPFCQWLQNIGTGSPMNLSSGRKG